MKNIIILILVVLANLYPVQVLANNDDIVANYDFILSHQGEKNHTVVHARIYPLADDALLSTIEADANYRYEIISTYPQFRVINDRAAGGTSLACEYIKQVHYLDLYIKGKRGQLLARGPLNLACNQRLVISVL